MKFTKRDITVKELAVVEERHLVDPITQKNSAPEHITVGRNRDVYMVSLTNQSISFTRDLPRYFALLVREYTVFFYVIRDVKIKANMPQDIYIKGIRIPKSLQTFKTSIARMIKESVTVYYQDYLIEKISLGKIENVTIYDDQKTM